MSQPFIIEDKNLLQSIKTLKDLYHKYENKELFTWKIALTDQETIKKFPESFCLFQPDFIEINPTVIKSYSDELFSIIKNQMQTDKNLIERLIHIVQEDLDLIKIVIYILNNQIQEIQKISQDYQIPISLLEFISTALTRPIRSKAAKQISTKVEIEKYWHKGTCPICAQFPLFGTHKKEDNARFLWCYRCDFTWRFNRIICPFCQNEDREKLHYLLVEDNKTFRLYLCDVCSHYIKIADEKELDSFNINFDKLYLITMNMDLIAQEKGYNSINILDIPRD